MNADTQDQRNPAKTHAVRVVGVDFTDVSEHLVKTAQVPARTVDDAVLHSVHVLRPQIPRLSLEALNASPYVEDQTDEAVRAELRRMRRPVAAKDSAPRGAAPAGAS